MIPNSGGNGRSGCAIANADTVAAAKANVRFVALTTAVSPTFGQTLREARDSSDQSAAQATASSAKRVIAVALSYSSCYETLVLLHSHHSTEAAVSPGQGAAAAGAHRRDRTEELRLRAAPKRRGAGGSAVARRRDRVRRRAGVHRRGARAGRHQRGGAHGRVQNRTQRGLRRAPKRRRHRDAGAPAPPLRGDPPDRFLRRAQTKGSRKDARQTRTPPPAHISTKETCSERRHLGHPQGHQSRSHRL